MGTTPEKIIERLLWFEDYNEDKYCGGDRIQDEHGDWYYKVTEEDFEAFRQAADIIRKYQEMKDKALPESTTKNSLEADCISRADARSLVVKIDKKYMYGMSDKAFHYLLKGIDEMPPVAPPELRWIPCGERLPEEDGEYCVTIYDKDEDYKYTDIAELEDGVWQYKSYIKVLAWAPLPKEYNEVKELDNSVNDLDSEEEEELEQE